MKRKSNLIFPIFVLLLVIGCIAVLFAANFLLSMPTQANILFGNPVPSSDLMTDIYNATYLVINKDVLLTSQGVEGDKIAFEIMTGETAYDVAVKLEQAGVISHAGAFIKYLQYKGYDRLLIANQYLLPTGLSAVEVAEKLRDPDPEFISITIYAGLRYEEFVELFDTLFVNFNETDFAVELEQEALELGLKMQNGSTQSYAAMLLPGQYTFHRDSNMEDITSEILMAFQKALTDDINQGLATHGLTLEDGLTLAAIIEREALHKDEMPRISSVFHNRLEMGMKLEADPTVQYSLGFQPSELSWWKSLITYSDLTYDSVFNTYVYPGLPPGPICNPSIEALQAAANPDQSDFLFFRTSCDGSGYHTFSYTYDKHLGNECP